MPWICQLIPPGQTWSTRSARGWSVPCRGCLLKSTTPREGVAGRLDGPGKVLTMPRPELTGSPAPHQLPPHMLQNLLLIGGTFHRWAGATPTPETPLTDHRNGRLYVYTFRTAGERRARGTKTHRAATKSTPHHHAGGGRAGHRPRPGPQVPVYGRQFASAAALCSDSARGRWVTIRSIK